MLPPEGDFQVTYTALSGFATALLVFPFRAESVDVFEWAAGLSSSWKPTYDLALAAGVPSPPAAGLADRLEVRVLAALGSPY